MLKKIRDRINAKKYAPKKPLNNPKEGKERGTEGKKRKKERER